jgi:hypothetical protein
MIEVYCEQIDCKFNKDGTCGCQLLSIDEFGSCEDYQEITEEERYPDIFYKQNKIPNEQDKPRWEKTRGQKIEFIGREMFIRDGAITDGRTGSILCMNNNESMKSIKKEVMGNSEKFFERIKEIESFGISPLYESEEKT